jgi:histone acetyltransferase 1
LFSHHYLLYVVSISFRHSSPQSKDRRCYQTLHDYGGMAPAAEPSSKRVRFDPSLTPAVSSSGATSAVKLDANDVIQLRFVHSSADVHADGAGGTHNASLCFNPTFTHQIFPRGLCGLTAATIALYYTSASLHCWLDCDVRLVDRDRASDDARATGADNARSPESLAGASHSEQDAMTEESLRNTLGRFIHAGRVTDREEFLRIADEDSQYVPPVSTGDLVLTYDVQGKSGNRQFSVVRLILATSSDVRDYHKRMQLLMFLFIDGASFIDDSDPRWEIFVILEHVNDVPKYLVGYATVYPFLAMRPGKPRDAFFAERIRVSQVFVLPRYQRGGHGSRLLTAIYKNAHQRGAFEVTVEDPSEGFRLLRDVTDLPRAYEAGVLDANVPLDPEKHAAVCTSLRERLLLTKAQARRCLEVHNLRFVDRENAGDYKTYRLWVKRRLHEEYLEVLDAFSAGDERKAKLGEIYADYEREYLCVVNRLRFKLHSSL